MADNTSAATALKEKGNAEYKAKNYRKAIQIYTEALQKDPKLVPCLTNRAAARMMLGGYAEAAEDCEKAVEIDSNNIKAYNRGGKAYLCMGEFEKAKRMYTSALIHDPRDDTALAESKIVDLTKARLERANEILLKGDPNLAIRLIESATKDAPAAVDLQLLRVKAKIAAKQYDDAFAITTDLLPKLTNDRRLLLLRAKALQYQGKVALACRHLQEAMRLDPDNTEIVRALKTCRKLESAKESGNGAFKSGRNEEAVAKYTEALTIDPTNDNFNITLYANRAAARMKLKQWGEAADDCSKALNIDENHYKARMRRAQCLYNVGDEDSLSQGVRDLDAAKRNTTDRRVIADIEKDLRKYQAELKKAKRKDYYKMLNVSKDADEAAIKKAYKKAALKWHPDRHASKSETDKKKAEQMFKNVGEAYNILSDPEKKRQYDMGADIEEIESGVPAGARGAGGMGADPMDLFSMFFGGGGGGMRSAGGFGGFPGGVRVQFG